MLAYLCCSLDRLPPTDTYFPMLYRYIYQDKAYINSSNAVPLLYAAKKYILPDLEQRCTAFLEGSVTLDNVCTLLEQGVQVDERQLIDRCLNLIMLRTKEVIATSNWLELGPSALAAVLNCPSLSVSEIDVFKACVAWATEACIKASKPPVPTNLQTMLGDLLYAIQMTNMNLQEFSVIVVPSGLLSDKDELTVYKKLTSPFVDIDTPFASGRQNLLRLIKPLHIIDSSNGGECNYDSEPFEYMINVLESMRLLELHLYDLMGPHEVHVTIRTKLNVSPTNSIRQHHQRSQSQAPIDFSVRQLCHVRQYEEKDYKVFVYRLDDSLNLAIMGYDLTLTILGEFNTEMFDPLQYGDKQLSIARGGKDSPLIALGYILDNDVQNSKQMWTTTQASNRKATLAARTKMAPPPVPPRNKSLHNYY